MAVVMGTTLVLILLEQRLGHQSLPALSARQAGRHLALRSVLIITAMVVSGIPFTVYLFYATLLLALFTLGRKVAYGAALLTTLFFLGYVITYSQSSFLNLLDENNLFVFLLRVLMVLLLANVLQQERATRQALQQAHESQPMIRTLIAADQWLVREGIASLLEIEDEMEVVGIASDGQEAVALVTALQPDIILMDIRMPNLSGIEITAQIKEMYPGCQIIMLTTFDDEECVVQSLLAGACGYLMKDIPAPDLAQAIRLAHSGVYQLAPEVTGRLVGALRDMTDTLPTPAPDIPLNPRETEILRLLAKLYATLTALI